MFRLVIHVEDKRLADVLKLLTGKVQIPDPPVPILVAAPNGASERSLGAVLSQVPKNFSTAEFAERAEAIGYSTNHVSNLLYHAKGDKLIVKKGRGQWSKR